MSKVAAIYARVSSSRQEEDGTSLDTQIERCRDYAEKQGWEVRPDLVFREVFTGAKYRERPALSRMRRLVRAKQVEVVLCYAWDRLARDQDHIAVLIDEMDHAGAQLDLVTEDVDNSAIGKQIRNMLNFASAIEREKLIERTTRGRRERVLRGKLFPGGKPTYGYQWPDEHDERGRRNRGRYVVDPATAPVVQRVFRELVGGNTLRQLSIALTNEAVPTPTGQSHQWRTGTLANMLHNPAYKGEAWGWGNKRRTEEYPQHFDDEDAFKLPDGTIPPLIDAETWDAAQAILTRNKARAIRSAKNPEGALLRGGYVRCGYCHGPMYPRPRSNGVLEYVCKYGGDFPGICKRPSIVAHKVDEDVWNHVREVLTNPAVVKEEIEKQRQSGKDPAANELVSLDRLLAQVAKQQNVTAGAVGMLDDPDAAAPLLVRLERLADQKRNLLSERARLLEQQVAWEAQQTELDSLEEWCSTVSANLEELTYQQKRLALDVLGFKVTVYKADHTPRWQVTAEIPLEVDSSTI